MHAADHAPQPIIFALASRRPSTHGALDQGVSDGGRLAAADGADEENGGMTVLGGRPVRPHIEL